MPSPSILRRRKPPVLEEVEEEEEQAEPTLSERRANARRVADLLLELDDERDCIDALYAAAQRALADWAIEFVTVRKRDPTSAEVRESPVWPFVRKKTAEAEVRRLALNQTLSTMGQPSMPQPSADRGRRAADRTAGTAAEGATAVGTSYGTFNNERARLLLLRALEPRVLQPPDATAELRAYFCTVALAIESAKAGDNGFEGSQTRPAATDEELEQAALLFAHFDTDCDGALNREEFVALLGLVAAKAGHSYSQEHLDAMFNEADINGEGNELDLNELLMVLLESKGPDG